MIKNLSKEKRDQLILTIMGALCILAALWLGVVKGQKSKIKQRESRLEQLTEEVTTAQRRIGNMEANKQELETLRGHLEVIEDGMARGDLYSWMIITLNNFKMRHQVDIPQISRETLNEVVIIPRFPYQTATFKVQGSAYYHGLGTFIADFENTFPFMRIHNLEIAPLVAASDNNAASQSEKLVFNMDIVTLVKSAPNSAL